LATLSDASLLSLHDALPISLHADVALALQALGGPGRTVLELAGGLHVLGHGDELLECGLGARGNTEVRAEHAADLGRFDIDMHEDRKSTRLNSSHVKISYAV